MLRRTGTVLALAGLLIARVVEAQAPTFISTWGSFGTGDNQFYTPVGVATNLGGDVFVIDSNNCRVQRFSSDGVYVTQWGSQGSGNSQFALPSDIAVDSNGDVYVADTVNGRIQKFSGTGTFLTSWIAYSHGIAVDALDNVWISGREEVRKFTSNGSLIAQWPVPPGYIDDVAVDVGGNVFVVDRDGGHILKFTSAGTYITEWNIDRIGASPVRLAVDRAGRVFVDEYGTCRIEVFTGDGTYIMQWGSPGPAIGQFANPIGIAVDGDFIYVADTNNSRIQKFGFVPTSTSAVSWGSIKAAYR